MLPKLTTDKVKLGKSGLTVSFVGIGTGTQGYGNQSVQTRLGQRVFTQLMRHALESGITLFDLADNYGSNPFFGRAMEGVPRDSYVIQSKIESRDPSQAQKDLDRILRELRTDYIDSLIIHCVTEADWSTRFRGVMDVLAAAKQNGTIRAHGVTCHSLAALRAAAENDWVEIHQVRWNPRGAHMDADVATAGHLFRRMRESGQGMIGMKVCGEGDIVRGNSPLTPEECYRFQIESGVVDAFVVGVDCTAHIDQLICGTQSALDDLRLQKAA